MIKPRRKYTPQQKFEIVKEGLLSGAQISEVCRRHGISTVTFYDWQKKFFDGAVSGLKPKSRKSKNNTIEQKQRDRIKRLESVIAEITEENLSLKKIFGD
ncbi:MAG: transposase [Candidatus Lokiarchaeota archaeon]|nr:transposase [Candidatus Lokiarchaeota archaeon]